MTATRTNSLHVSNTRFAAVPTAARRSRMFVQQTLQVWHLELVVDVAELIVSELVTNAVQATGISGEHAPWSASRAEPVIGVQLCAVGQSLSIEVWDGDPAVPVRRQSADDDEHGRGLLLIDVLASRWGVFPPRSGGKVVWAEVALTGPDTPRTGGPAADRASAAMLERLLDELRSG